jgi:acetyl esterase/lipase
MVQHGRFPAPRRTGALAAALLLGLLSAARAEPAFTDPWPAVGDAAGRIVAVPSHSPFVPSEIGPGAPATPARVTWYPPAGTDAANSAPAVVLLHGAAGIDEHREPTYARQLAAMGIGAAVVDVFGARRDLATSFTDRVIRITETMALADAYATLAWLKARPEIDGGRVAVWGFSYGAMASIVATNAATPSWTRPIARPRRRRCARAGRGCRPSSIPAPCTNGTAAARGRGRSAGC